jgi:hypothetical protein
MVYFTDSFDGASIDTNKWQVYQHLDPRIEGARMNISQSGGKVAMRGLAAYGALLAKQPVNCRNLDVTVKVSFEGTGIGCGLILANQAMPSTAIKESDVWLSVLAFPGGLSVELTRKGKTYNEIPVSERLDLSGGAELRIVGNGGTFDCYCKAAGATEWSKKYTITLSDLGDEPNYIRLTTSTALEESAGFFDDFVATEANPMQTMIESMTSIMMTVMMFMMMFSIMTSMREAMQE